ncbi:TIGR01212 family radical SAM protein [Halochromatium salexigens]|uniref:TIGR01212 family radical SAM protein n=1 Tax=Halochromatium salexigens TaxID=49447 RepID=A0AAJ0UIG8_HALSE|nr:TIGR01212 family radical SAM protein [Halochromatium salexigens]MBK5932111.1 TIGR01212 family radical SAM protein [Halochromatium salexigens]
MTLADRVNTFGVDLVRRYGRRVHKLAIHAGFTCPNRDGTKGRGGCSFCNNVSFSPNADSPSADKSAGASRFAPERSVAEQIACGRQVVRRRTGAERYFAYFQAYTNTYDDIARLGALYEQALDEPDVIGLSVGTRPDCVPDAVLDLLAGYRAAGHEIWLELGLQSAFDSTLARVNRGHSFADYRRTVRAARLRGIPVCTHLIIGLPGEGRDAALETLARVIALGTDGLKLHPLHVVRQTVLAHQWRRGGYQPLTLEDYIEIAADLIERTPEEVLYHRVTGTAQREILLAPEWCSKKWIVLNGIENALRRRGTRQGCLALEQSLYSCSSAIERVA